jgi:NTE family protein
VKNKPTTVVRPRRRKVVAPSPGAVARALARYEVIALTLQGGGALGSYQGGVYAALRDAGIEPTFVAGISIGAINAALIAGNPPERRVARLREFWTRISHGHLLSSVHFPWLDATLFGDLTARSIANFWSASLAIVRGQDGFFSPRMPPPWAVPPGSSGATSFYDTAPLEATLAELVDWKLLNRGPIRLAVGAVNVATGNFKFFDTAHHVLTPRHVMASGALPPAFAPVEIPGEGLFWDGGLVSNTPLEYVLDADERFDTLAFQVDLWSAKGHAPRDLLDVFERQKDIQYSSRTRKGTNRFEDVQNIRHHIAAALAALPARARRESALAALAPFACRKVMNVIHLIYQTKVYENHAKDYEFSELTLDEHWSAGVEDVRATLAMPRVLARPPASRGVITHDVHRREKKP